MLAHELRNVLTTIVLLHGFQKKSQKTPKADLDLAHERMKGTASP
jgi:phage-related protein